MKAKFSSFAIESLLAAAVVFGASAARGDERLDEAQRLFDQARQLLAAGAVAEACTKLEASLELDPANGTRLNLAVCREREGKLAAASQLFIEVVREGKLLGQDDRVGVAMKHLDAIGPSVPTIEVRVPRATRDAGVRLFVDGVDREIVLRGGTLLVEAGAHHLELRAEDGRRGVAEVTLVPGERAIVDIDLAKAEPASPPAPSPALAPVAPASGPIAPPVAAIAAPVAPAEASSGWPIALAVAIGAGGVALGVGVGFGVRAAALDAEADAACPPDLEGRCENAGAAADAEAAGDAATAANVLIGAGLVVVAASIVTLAIAPWDRRREVASGLMHRGAPGARGVALAF